MKFFVFDRALSHVGIWRWAFKVGRGVGLVWLGLWACQILVQAAPPVQWIAPSILTKDILNDLGKPARTSYPVLVADSWGDVHLLFPAQINSNSSAVGDTLYYTRWTGVDWEPPIDILYHFGRNIWLPQAAVDSRGFIHVAWSSEYLVWYSRAPVTEANRAFAWSAPLLASVDIANHVSMTTDVQGGVHIVYCTVDENRRAAYIKSVDGRNWTAPRDLGSVVFGCTPRIAIDGLGRLHVVYGDHEGIGVGNVIYYTRSDNFGDTWTPPREVDRKDERYWEAYGPTWGNVITRGFDDVHIIWDGAPGGQRWHQISNDGGQTWTQPRQVSPDQRGLTGPNGLAFDSQGNLHMITLGWLETRERPSGAWYTVWRDGQWAPLSRIPNGGEGPSLAISGDQTLLSAWWVQRGKELDVWATHARTDAPPIAPGPRPTIETLPNLTPDTDPADLVSLPPILPTRTPTVAKRPNLPPGQATGLPDIPPPWQAMLLTSILPSLALVGLAFLIRLRR